MLLNHSSFSPFAPLCPVPSFSSAFLPFQFMSMGHEYKFFGYSISYTILNISLSVLFLPLMLLNPCTFLPIHPLPPPS